MKSIVFLALSIIACSFWLVSCKASKGNSEITYTVLLNSWNNGPANAVEKEITSKEELEALFNTNSKVKSTVEISLDKNRYALISVGELPSGGYNLSISEVVKTKEGVQISYQLTKPAKGSMTISVVVNPFILLQLPAIEGKLIFKRLEDKESQEQNKLN